MQGKGVKNTDSYDSAMELLTDKQKRFISVYLKTGNGTEAAREAGYKGNAKTLGVCAVRLLKSDSIKNAIRLYKEKNELVNELDILSKDNTLVLLSNLARGTDPNGKQVPPAIQHKALDSLLRYYGVTEKIEITGNIDIATVLNSARNRLERLNTIENEVPQEALLTN